MKQIIMVILFISCFTITNSCGKDESEPLELRILNKKLVAYNNASQKDTINILRFKVKNNSDNIYYFTPLQNEIFLKTFPPHKGNLSVRIYDEKIVEADYINLNPSHLGPNETVEDSTCISRSGKIFSLQMSRLSTEKQERYFINREVGFHFFIHPGETLFFETYLNLTDTLEYEFGRNRYAILKSDSKYHAQIYLVSDSTTVNELPDFILKTIEENNARIYHGALKSKNDVRVRVLN
jgi:hypothetical protein